MIPSREIQVYEYDTATGFITYRWFGGLVADEDALVETGSGVWEVSCQGYDILLDSIICDDNQLHGTTNNTNFAAQVAQMMNTWLTTPTTASRLIDYAGGPSYNFDPLVLLPHVSWKNTSIRVWLQDLANTLQSLVAARRLRFTLLPPNSTGTATFGEPQLTIWDAADPLQVPAYTFTDAVAPGAGELAPLYLYKRSIKGSQMWPRRGANGVDGSVWQVYEDATAKATYPNPWAPNGAHSIVPLSNTAWATNADALAAVTRDVAAHAYPVESWVLGTYARVLPGAFILVKSTILGVAGTLLPVAGVHVTFNDPVGVPKLELTLGARLERYGDPDGTAALSPVQFGSGANPDPPTALAISNGSHGVYQPATNDVLCSFSWTAPGQPIATYQIRRTLVATGVHRFFGPFTSTNGDVPGNLVTTAYTFEVQAFDYHNHGSSFSTPALAVTTADASGPPPILGLALGSSGLLTGGGGNGSAYAKLTITPAVGPAPYQYVCEYGLTGGPALRTAPPIPGGVTGYMIYPLDANTRYDFNMYARDQWGNVSTPVSLTNQLIAPGPLPVPGPIAGFVNSSPDSGEVGNLTRWAAQTFTGTVTPTLNTTTVKQGGQSLQVALGTSSSGSYLSDPVDAQAGNIYALRLWLQASVVTGVTPALTVRWYDASGSPLTPATPTLTALSAGAWVLTEATVTAPATAVSVRWEVGATTTSNASNVLIASPTEADWQRQTRPQDVGLATIAPTHLNLLTDSGGNAVAVKDTGGTAYGKIYGGSTGLTLAATTGAVNLQGATGVVVLSQLQLSGAGLALSLSTQSANFTADTTAVTYPCDTTSATITATLPDCAGASGTVYCFLKTDASAHTVKVTRAGSDSIEGAINVTLTAQYDYLIVKSLGGTVWKRLGGIVGGVALGAGSVSSVALTGDGTVFNASVPGSPVTGAGTFAPTLHTQTKNTALLGPASGSAAAPTFRALGTADLPSGTSFPGSPATNDTYYRTDLGVWCQWDGTRWLGPEVPIPMHNYLGAPPYSATIEALACSIRSDYKLYLTRFAASFYCGGGVNGSNYWDVSLRRFTAGAGSVDTICSLRTIGQGWDKVAADATTGGMSNNPLNLTDIVLQVYLAKTLNPNPIYVQASVWGRYIYT